MNIYHSTWQWFSKYLLQVPPKKVILQVEPLNQYHNKITSWAYVFSEQGGGLIPKIHVNLLLQATETLSTVLESRKIKCTKVMITGESTEHIE